MVLKSIDLAYMKFSTINFYLLGGVISDLALVLIGIIITIFVLTVTLLGKAAKLAEEKKITVEQTNQQEFDKQIIEIEQKLKDHPADNIEELQKNINSLKTKRNYTENQLKQLEAKYNSLGLRKSVLIPGGFFITSLICGNWLILISQNQVWRFICFVLAAIFLGIGIKNILLSLKVISEVSLSADNYQYEQLQNAFIQSLRNIESEKEPKPQLRFNTKDPFIFKAQSEQNVDFSIYLSKLGNQEAKNLEIWFCSSAELELLKSNMSDEPKNQFHTSIIPEANAIRYKLGNLRFGNSYALWLKIKPTKTGAFKLMYKISCDNHVELFSSEREINIIVED